MEKAKPALPVIEYPRPESLLQRLQKLLSGTEDEGDAPGGMRMGAVDSAARELGSLRGVAGGSEPVLAAALAY